LVETLTLHHLHSLVLFPGSHLSLLIHYSHYIHRFSPYLISVSFLVLVHPWIFHSPTHCPPLCWICYDQTCI
jgi:hypothetical protein